MQQLLGRKIVSSFFVTWIISKFCVQHRGNQHFLGLCFITSQSHGINWINFSIFCLDCLLASMEIMFFMLLVSICGVILTFRIPKKKKKKFRCIPVLALGPRNQGLKHFPSNLFWRNFDCKRGNLNKLQSKKSTFLAVVGNSSTCF